MNKIQCEKCGKEFDSAQLKSMISEVTAEKYGVSAILGARYDFHCPECRSPITIPCAHCGRISWNDVVKNVVSQDASNPESSSNLPFVVCRKCGGAINI